MPDGGAIATGPAATEPLPRSGVPSPGAGRRQCLLRRPGMASHQRDRRPLPGRDSGVSASRREPPGGAAACQEALPRDLSIPPDPADIPDHLLPMVLKASHKGMLDRFGRVALDHRQRPENADRPLYFRFVPSHYETGKNGPGGVFPVCGSFTPESHQQRVGASRQPGPDLRGGGGAAVERGVGGRKFPGDVAGGFGNPQPLPGPYHRAHRCGAPVPGPDVSAGP